MTEPSEPTRYLVVDCYNNGYTPKKPERPFWEMLPEIRFSRVGIRFDFDYDG